MTFCDSLAIELCKAPLQAMAVATGVFLGWWLNGRSQRRSKVKDTRAEWAATAELALVSILSDNWSRVLGVASGEAVMAAKFDDVATRQRASFLATGNFSAATMRLALLDHADTSKEAMKIDARVVKLTAEYGQNLTKRIDAVRADVRSVMSRWGVPSIAETGDQGKG